MLGLKNGGVFRTERAAMPQFSVSRSGVCSKLQESHRATLVFGYSFDSGGVEIRCSVKPVFDVCVHRQSL